MEFKWRLRKFYYWLFPRMYEESFETEIKYVEIESPIQSSNDEIEDLLFIIPFIPDYSKHVCKDEV